MDLAYDVIGPRDAPPVVLLHGLSGARTTWAEVVPALETTYRVFTVDQRGHGDSPRAAGEYRVEHYGADLVDFIDGVVGAQVTLVGHSLGGLVSAYVAGRHPDVVRGAFLEDPPLYMGDKDDFSTTIFAAFFPVALQVLTDLRAKGADVAEYEALAHAIPAMTGEGTLADLLGPEKTRVMAETLRAFDPEAFVPAIDGSLFDAFDVDARIEVPVRLLRAEPRAGRRLLRRARGALPQDAPVRFGRPRAGRHPRHPRGSPRRVRRRARQVPRQPLGLSGLHDRRRVAGPVPVAEQALVELACRQPRQLVLEVDGARALVRREVLPAEGDELALDVGPGRRRSGMSWTTALTSSPMSSFGTPMTAASITFGCVTSRFSVSCG